MSSSDWDKIYSDGKQLNRYPYDSVVSFIMKEKANNPHLKVLDIGCGTGNHVVFMAKEGLNVYGIDISQHAISYAKSRATEEKINVNLTVSSYVDLPFDNQIFDLVLDRSALNCESNNNIKHSISEILRVLKPSGKIFSTMYSTLHPAFPDKESEKGGFITSFDDGHFLGIDGIYFSSENDLNLFYSEFDLLDYQHHVVYGKESEVLEAHWEVVATK